MSLIDDLESLSEETSNEVPTVLDIETKVEKPTLGTVDYPQLKKLALSTKLYAVMNTGDRDLMCDWDLPLMPDDLREEFDRYLSDKYNQFKLSEVTASMRLVAISINKGQSINFLHNFMTEKRIPVLETIVEGANSSIRSQFVIPAKETVICTEKQLESLKRYEKKRHVVGDKPSDWYGFLVFKELPEAQLEKVKYSVATSKDLKSNGFVLGAQPISTKRIVAGNIELSDELDNLF